MIMRYRYLRFPKGRPKALTLSYDDGCPQDIRLADTLSQYGIKCTFNFNCDAIKGARALTREQVIEHMLNRGHEIAVHGEWHVANGTLRPIEGIREVLNCRLELEAKYDRIIRGMAYPDVGIRRFSNGTVYSDVKTYLTELDIAYCRTIGADNDGFEMPTDWHAWMPTAHHNNPAIDQYIDKFLALDFSTDAYIAARQPRLFYMWGHAFEFDSHDNWDLLTHICERLSGKDDVWYATNIEICDYVRAYESLVYSADRHIIYNPTLHKIWFDIDKVLYSIEPGETLRIGK